MTVEVRREAGYWSVYVNGVRTVDRESFAVADRVAYYLRNPKARAADYSESADVAEQIAKHFSEERT